MSNLGPANFNFINFVSQVQALRPGPVFGPDGLPTLPIYLNNATGLPQPGIVPLLAKFSLAELFQQEGMRLTQQETVLFIKDLLKLPQEVSSLLRALASPAEAGVKNPNQSLKDLIAQLPTPPAVSVDDIQKLLAKNTKEATDKLLQLLQTTQVSQGKGGPQVAALLTALTQLTASIQQSPHIALEALTLLYLPWYPLHLNQKLDFGFEWGEGEGGGGEREISIVLYLQTNTLGRFKVVVTESDPLQVIVQIGHEIQAKPILGQLETDLNTILAADGLPHSIFTANIIEADQSENTLLTEDETASPKETEPALEGFRKATRQANKQKMDIQSGTQISVLVLQTAYSIARLVFEADENNQFLQTKKT